MYAELSPYCNNNCHVNPTALNKNRLKQMHCFKLKVVLMMTLLFHF